MLLGDNDGCEVVVKFMNFLEAEQIAVFVERVEGYESQGSAELWVELPVMQRHFGLIQKCCVYMIFS